VRATEKGATGRTMGTSKNKTIGSKAGITKMRFQEGGNDACGYGDGQGNILGSGFGGGGGSGGSEGTNPGYGMGIGGQGQDADSDRCYGQGIGSELTDDCGDCAYSDLDLEDDESDGELEDESD